LWPLLIHFHIWFLFPFTFSFFKCCHISDTVMYGGRVQFKIETPAYPVKLFSVTICGFQKLKWISFCICHFKQNM
jgi:hypothetical protein